MAGGTYKNYIRLLDNWPIDKTKFGKDLSQHIREEIIIAFSKGESHSSIDKAKCERYYASLQRISSNYYAEKYKRSLNSTFFGISADQCNILLSSEAQNFFKEKKENFFQKLFNRTKKENNSE